MKHIHHKLEQYNDMYVTTADSKEKEIKTNDKKIYCSCLWWFLIQSRCGNIYPINQGLIMNIHEKSFLNLNKRIETTKKCKTVRTLGRWKMSIPKKKKLNTQFRTCKQTLETSDLIILQRYINIPCIFQ